MIEYNKFTITDQFHEPVAADPRNNINKYLIIVIIKSIVNQWIESPNCHNQSNTTSLTSSKKTTLVGPRASPRHGGAPSGPARFSTSTNYTSYFSKCHENKIPKKSSVDAIDGRARAKERLFVDHIERSIQNVVGQNLSIHRFSLRAEQYQPDRWDLQLNRWTQQSVEAKVEDLRLVLPTGLSEYYMLPPFVLLSETITQLRLSGCDIKHYNSVNLPNLFLLNLSHIALRQGMIEKFTSGSPKLESLEVINCRSNRLLSICVSGLAKLNFLNLSLRRSFKGKNAIVVEVKIIAPQLRVLEVSYNRWSEFEIDVYVPSLKKLTLCSKYAMKGQIESFVSMFRGLEELVLFGFNVRSIKISKQNLRTLKVRHFTSLRRVDINAPNLQVLKLNWCTRIERVDNVNAPNLRVLKVSLCNDLERVDNINAPNLQLLKVKWECDSLKRVDINAFNLQVLKYNDYLQMYTKLQLGSDSY